MAESERSSAGVRALASVSRVIAAREVAYDTDGLTMIGHLAYPEGEGRRPAVLVAHDGVGLDDYQRGRADDLARNGYVAFAMDYHGGRTFFGSPRAMLDRVMPLMADPARMRAIGSAALDVLLAHPGADRGRLGAVGYGAGGRIALELAGAGVPFRALAAIHPGLPPARSADWTGVTGSFLLCTGSEDPLCTPGQIFEFGRALQEAGLDWRANIYGGARHAFWAAPTTTAAGTVPSTVPGVGYHPVNAERAWRAVLDLLGETT